MKKQIESFRIHPDDKENLQNLTNAHKYNIVIWKQVRANYLLLFAHHIIAP